MSHYDRPVVRWMVTGTLLCSMAAHGQTVEMFATTDSTSGTNPNTLLSIDISDGTQTLAGTQGAATGTRNIDYDRVSGVLIGTDIFEQPGFLFQVDSTSGVSTPAAFLQQGGNPLRVGPVAYAPNGTLFAIVGFNTAEPHDLGIVDLAEQTFTPILSFPAGRLYTGMDFAPDGMLYAVHTEFPQQTLSVIDVSVPGVVDQIPISTLNVGDMDFASNGFIYHSNFSAALVRMEPQTGAQTVVGFGSLGAPAGLASLPGTTPVASTGFVGEIRLVEVDTGAGQFAGKGIGSIFSGIFNYGDSVIYASEVYTETNERDFLFLAEPFHSTLFDGMSAVTSLEVSVNHQNNVAIDEEEASLLSQLLGQTVNVGTIIDTWAVAALSIGAYEEDPDPNDQDDTELLFDGVLFDMVFIDLDADLLDSLEYRPTAPGIDDVDLVIFTVNEANASGQLLYSALGVVSSLADDTDNDGIADAIDDCLAAANTGQVDSDADGHGNRCDADFDNNCFTTFPDLSIMQAGFFTIDPLLDLDGSGGPVNFADLAIMQELFFLAPGPSAPGALCNP